MSDSNQDADQIGFFNIQDFKNWMAKNGGTSFGLAPKKTQGVEVESKVSIRRLMNRMDVESGKSIDLAREFCESGGKVVESDSDMFLIAVSCGKFYIPRNCVCRT